MGVRGGVNHGGAHGEGVGCRRVVTRTSAGTVTLPQTHSLDLQLCLVDLAAEAELEAEPAAAAAVEPPLFLLALASLRSCGVPPLSLPGTLGLFLTGESASVSSPDEERSLFDHCCHSRCTRRCRSLGRP